MHTTTENRTADAAARTEAAILRYIRLTDFHPDEQDDIYEALCAALVLLEDEGPDALASRHTPGVDAASIAWRHTSAFASRALTITRC